MTKNVQTLEFDGKTFVVLESAEYERLRAAADSGGQPALPPADVNGRYPATEYSRASLARKLISLRSAAGLSIEQLARKAKVSAKMIKDIESGVKPVNVAAVDRIDRVLVASRS